MQQRAYRPKPSVKGLLNLMFLENFLHAWLPRGLGILRLVTGFLFLQHGSVKLLGFPYDANSAGTRPTTRRLGVPSRSSKRSIARSPAAICTGSSITVRRSRTATLRASKPSVVASPCSIIWPTGGKTLSRALARWRRSAPHLSPGCSPWACGGRRLGCVLASESPGWSLWQCREPPALGPTEPGQVDWESGVCPGRVAGGAPYNTHRGLQSLSGGPRPARDRARAGCGLHLGVGHVQVLTTQRAREKGADDDPRRPGAD